MTFTNHFEEILERCNKFHRPRILVNKKWGPSRTTISQIYKQCERPVFEYRIVSTINNKTQQNTKSPELFLKAGTSSSKICVGSLIHEASGFPYAERDSSH